MSILRRRPREVYSVWPDGLEESPPAGGDDWELAFLQEVHPPAEIDPAAPADDAEAGQSTPRRRPGRLPAVAAVSGASAALVVVTAVALERGDSAVRQPRAGVDAARRPGAASRKAPARWSAPSPAARRGRPRVVQSSAREVRSQPSRAQPRPGALPASARRTSAPIAPTLPHGRLPSAARRPSRRSRGMGEFGFEGANT